MRAPLVLLIVLALPATAPADDASPASAWKRFDKHPMGLEQLLSTSRDAKRATRFATRLARLLGPAFEKSRRAIRLQDEAAKLFAKL